MWYWRNNSAYASVTGPVNSHIQWVKPDKFNELVFLAENLNIWLSTNVLVMMCVYMYPISLSFPFYTNNLNEC